MLLYDLHNRSTVGSMSILVLKEVNILKNRECAYMLD